MSIPRVALLVETSKHYGRGVLKGIQDYIALHGPWSAAIEECNLYDPVPELMRSWEGDGILTRLDLGRKLRHGESIVNLAQHLGYLPAVFPDDRRIVAIALEHLIAEGFSRFAYCGRAGFVWSENRKNAFLRDTDQMGYPSSVLMLRGIGTQGLKWRAEVRELTSWLTDLKKPVGILASHDTLGLRLLSVCQRLGVDVPHDVAVIGVDNDPVICELSRPTLSSVDVAVETIGYQAASLLDAQMQSSHIDESIKLIPPNRVVVRESSDVIRLDDRQLATAIKFIRDHAFQEITPADVARHASMSRRTLERRFRNAMGRSPSEEILFLRIERAKHLLAKTIYTVSRISRLVGFDQDSYFCTAFKRVAGITPGEYRRNNS